MLRCTFDESHVGFNKLWLNETCNLLHITAHLMVCLKDRNGTQSNWIILRFLVFFTLPPFTSICIKSQIIAKTIWSHYRASDESDSSFGIEEYCNLL